MSCWWLPEDVYVLDVGMCVLVGGHGISCLMALVLDWARWNGCSTLRSLLAAVSSAKWRVLDATNQILTGTVTGGGRLQNDGTKKEN